MQNAVNMIDTHCHLDFSDFDTDRDQVIANAHANSVSKIVVPAVSQATWHTTIRVCQQYTGCYLALGLHPVFIDNHQPQHLTELDELISQHRPIAVGEIGLDFYLKKLDREKQLAFFTKQLIIAKQHKLPVIIHNRKAHDDCLRLLQEHPVNGGIIHAFNGSVQHAQKYIELGFALGFGGMLTFERSSKLRSLAQTIPLENIVLETDAPDMVVSEHIGERNSPEYLPLIASTLAELKLIPEQTVAATTSSTARKILSI